MSNNLDAARILSRLAIEGVTTSGGAGGENKLIKTNASGLLDNNFLITDPALTSHIADATKHLTTDQNTLLDGLVNTLTHTELNYVDGVTSAIQTQLDNKAPLASPALTGVPTAPTAAASTNTTQIATTAFVRTEVANLVASAPGALDTLDELSAALGDDANFASTITTALSGKEPTQTAASQVEAEAGTGTAIRSWTPERIKQAIEALGGAGGGGKFTTVKVATFSNINVTTMLEAGDALDSITLTAGDLVLVKDQSTPSQNGIYRVAASGAATRAPNYSTHSDFYGLVVSVENGATNYGSLWAHSGAYTGVIDTANLTFKSLKKKVPSSDESCYIDTITGSDLTGDGSIFNPYSSIQPAFNTGYRKFILGSGDVGSLVIPPSGTLNLYFIGASNSSISSIYGYIADNVNITGNGLGLVTIGSINLYGETGGTGAAGSGYGVGGDAGGVGGSVGNLTIRDVTVTGNITLAGGSGGNGGAGSPGADNGTTPGGTGGAGGAAGGGPGFASYNCFIGGAVSSSAGTPGNGGQGGPDAITVGSGGVGGNGNAGGTINIYDTTIYGSLTSVGPDGGIGGNDGSGSNPSSNGSNGSPGSITLKHSRTGTISFAGTVYVDFSSVGAITYTGDCVLRHSRADSVTDTGAGTATIDFSTLGTITVTSGVTTRVAYIASTFYPDPGSYP